MAIAFGVAIASEEKFKRWARPSIERIAEPDSLVLTRRGHDSIQVPYNEILDEAARVPGLEALVLLHEDVEIRDPQFCEKLRWSLSLPGAALVGPIGGCNVHSIAWWQNGPRFGRVDAPNVDVLRLCRGEFDIGWHEVEALDGLLLAASPWTVRHVRFDERFAPTFHGYDVDFSFQVRALGHRCLVAPLDVTHYGTWKIEQHDRWVQSAVLWERKWAVRRTATATAGMVWA
jgi:glycosyl transferase family 2